MATPANHQSKKIKRIPKNLQGVLWSTSVNRLDLDKNKSYIINQILSLGTIDELRWLFKVYPPDKIKKTFLNQPAKIYTPSAFNFAKNILLNLEKQHLQPEAYVRSLPRNIRPQ
jgi:hypothetical protein